VEDRETLDENDDEADDISSIACLSIVELTTSSFQDSAK